MTKLKFKKPVNKLEPSGEASALRRPSAESIGGKCPGCRKNYFDAELAENLGVCARCGYHFRISAKRRLEISLDEGTFSELYGGLHAESPIGFPDYSEKLAALREKNPDTLEAVLCGEGEIGGNRAAVFAMEPQFLMGSMGIAAGEKITRLFEYAVKERLPVVGFALSGGARMQEGIFSLMQMAKTAAAVRKHSESGSLYISVMCDPTTGGVTASFASMGDIIVAEPNALIGFAGPRVIEQTIRQKLPQNFQRAEFLLDKGFVDVIAPRQELKSVLSHLLALHGGERQRYGG